MTLFQRSCILFLSVVTVALCYVCYIFYFDGFSTNKKPSFFRLNIYPILLQVNSNDTSNQQKETSNGIIKEAIDLSNQIINHDNAKIKHGLLPESNDDKVEWFKPPLEVINYGDGTCSESDREVYGDIFARWKNLSETYKIPYFITDGTLIGAARNADIVPWDGDADIMVDGRFNEVVAAIADERGFDRYDGELHLVIQKDFREPVPEDKNDRLYYTEHRRRWDCWGKQVASQTDNCAFQEPFGRLIKNGHHMDLYDYHYKDDFIYEASGSQFEVPMVFPLRKCMFLQLELLCPQQTVNFLKKIYGDDVLPPKYKCNNTKWIP